MKSAIFCKGRVLSGTQANTRRNSYLKAGQIIHRNYGIPLKECRKYLKENGYYCAKWDGEVFDSTMKIIDLE